MIDEALEGLVQMSLAQRYNPVETLRAVREQVAIRVVV
jgi:hypothetical protein